MGSSKGSKEELLLLLFLEIRGIPRFDWRVLAVDQR